MSSVVEFKFDGFSVDMTRSMVAMRDVSFTYLLAYLFIYLRTYLLTYLLTYFLTYLLT